MTAPAKLRAIRVTDSDWQAWHDAAQKAVRPANRTELIRRACAYWIARNTDSAETTPAEKSCGP